MRILPIVCLFLGIFTLRGTGMVIELTADNFDQFTSEGDWIVEFYAPWCIHCQRMAPHLEKASNQIAGTTYVGKIDGPAWRSLTFRFGVSGYPTFFHIHNSPSSSTITPREVRRISPEHSVQGVLEIANGQWQEYEALPINSSPFGPWALVKYYGLFYGEKIFKIHEPISRWLDIPPVITGFCIGLVMLTAFTGSLIGFAAWLGPRRRDHED